ncbi:hypothetical protein EMIT0P228_100027 [Pseudomonas brassicacearum]
MFAWDSSVSEKIAASLRSAAPTDATEGGNLPSLNKKYLHLQPFTHNANLSHYVAVSRTSRLSHPSSKQDLP